jgi:hypothetical protein
VEAERSDFRHASESFEEFCGLEWALDGDGRLLQQWEISGKTAAVVVQHHELEDSEVGRSDGTYTKFRSTVKDSGAHINERELPKARRGGDQATELPSAAQKIEADMVEGER